MKIWLLQAFLCFLNRNIYTIRWDTHPDANDSNKKFINQLLADHCGCNMAIWLSEARRKRLIKNTKVNNVAVHGFPPWPPKHPTYGHKCMDCKDSWFLLVKIMCHCSCDIWFHFRWQPSCLQTMQKLYCGRMKRMVDKRRKRRKRLRKKKKSIEIEEFENKINSLTSKIFRFFMLEPWKLVACLVILIVFDTQQPTPPHTSSPDGMLA